MAPVNPEGQTAREQRAKTLADRVVEQERYYNGLARIPLEELLFKALTEEAAQPSEGQTAQEVRRAALEEAAEEAVMHGDGLDGYELAEAIRALASTPSPAKQTEQKIADQKGGDAHAHERSRESLADSNAGRVEVTPGAALQLGAAPATCPSAANSDFIDGRPVQPCGEPMPCRFHSPAPAQPDARDAEIARLRRQIADMEQERGEVNQALKDEMQGAARLTKELEEARAQGLLDGQDLVNLRQQVEDCIGNAQTDADGDGWITAYHFNTGSIHRLLAMARDIRPHQGRVFRTVGPPALAPPEPKAETPAETAGQKEGL